MSPASVDRIEHRRVAPTATLDRLCESVGYRIELTAVPIREVPLTREDRRSLAYHRLIAVKLLEATELGDDDRTRVLGWLARFGS